MKRLVFLVFAACSCNRIAPTPQTDGPPAPKPVVDASLAIAPIAPTLEASTPPRAISLPPDVFLAVHHHSGWVDHFTNAGKYLRAPDGATFAPGAIHPAVHSRIPDKLDAGTLKSVQRGIAESNLGSLPPELERPKVSPDARVAGGGGPPRFEKWTFTARLPDGRVVTVAAWGDSRVWQSFGPLMPLFRALDLAVYGFHTNE